MAALVAETSALATAFALFQKNGKMDIKDLPSAMRCLCVPTEPQVNAAMAAHGKKRVSQKAFEKIMAAHTAANASASTDHSADIATAFHVLDSSNQGFAELRSALCTLGDRMTLDEVDEIFKQAGVSDDVKMSLGAFTKLLKP
jgi:calmodulin